MRLAKQYMFSRCFLVAVAVELFKLVKIWKLNIAFRGTLMPDVILF